MIPFPRVRTIRTPTTRPAYRHYLIIFNFCAITFTARHSCRYQLLFTFNVYVSSSQNLRLNFKAVIIYLLRGFIRPSSDSTTSNTHNTQHTNNARTLYMQPKCDCWNWICRVTSMDTRIRKWDRWKKSTRDRNANVDMVFLVCQEWIG